MSLEDKKVIYKRRDGKTSHCHGQSATPGSCPIGFRAFSIYSIKVYTSVSREADSRLRSAYLV